MGARQTDGQTDGRQLHSPGRSRRSPRTPSSSSSAGTQSTRSGTWPPRGWGRRSSCGRGAGPGSWRRAADAQSLCIREAVERSDRTVRQTDGPVAATGGGRVCSVAAWIHFLRHCGATRRRQAAVLLLARQTNSLHCQDVSFGFGCFLIIISNHHTQNFKTLPEL